MMHGTARRGVRSGGIVWKSLHSGMPLLSACLSFVMALSSCGEKKEISGTDDILVSVGDSTLTLSDVVRRIPVGIEKEDSMILFRSIVDGWIEERVLIDMAMAKLPELDEIERKVSQYRNRLIVAEYLGKLRNGSKFKVDRDSVRLFYEAHKGELMTETPLVKGIYLKVSENSGPLADIRRCVYDASDESVDELEKNWMGAAIQYEYFKEEWVDWEVIADQIPYRFYDPDAFLSSTNNFETTCNGFTYLLHISDYLPSGSEMPYEFASERISAMLEQAKVSSYQEALVRALVQKAMSEGKLVAFGYDPLSRRFKDGDTNKKKTIQKDEK
ncbi:MAG: hypothetical protein K2M27_03095 [Muribaculaceae bacterium]|nr:hypothetical protein [Muribaculaceae bacterium]